LPKVAVECNKVAEISAKLPKVAVECNKVAVECNKVAEISAKLPKVAVECNKVAVECNELAQNVHFFWTNFDILSSKLRNLVLSEADASMVPGSLFLRKGTSVLFCLPVDRFVQAAVRLTTWQSVSPAAKAPNPVCCRLRPRCCCELLPACCSDCRIPCPPICGLLPFHAVVPDPAGFTNSSKFPNSGCFFADLAVCFWRNLLPDPIPGGSQLWFVAESCRFCRMSPRRAPPTDSHQPDRETTDDSPQPSKPHADTARATH
jgi:hypothetical protein